MGLHIILQNYNTTTDYDIPCVSGLLTEINAITAGTKLDKNGLAWTVARTDAGSGHLIEISANNTPYNIGQMEDIFKSLGFELSNYGNDFDNYVPDTNGATLYLRPDTVAGQYPSYEMSKTAPYDSGRYGERRDFVFDLDPTGNRQYNYMSYKFYNNSSHSQLQTVAKLYGGVLALDTTSGLGDFVFGEVVIQLATTGLYNSYQIRIYFNFDINGANWGMPDYSAGDKGFRPTGAFTKPNKPGVGGRGSTGKIDPDYKADQIFQPGAPDETSASAIGSGFLNLYKMSQAELDKVCACLYSETLLSAIATLAIDPLDFIVSLCIFPCAPNVGSSEAIKLGKWICLAATGVAGALGTAMSGTRLSSQYKTVPFGTLNIPENWGSFLDYSHTDIELYLPFIGSVSIDPSECMGGTINVEYTIDFLTGQCVANVLCSRPNAQLPNGKALSHVQAQHSYQGNCAVQIPLSAESYGAMVGNLINACCKSIASPTGAYGAIMDGLQGAYRPNISTKGSIVANSGFCSVLYPYVRITRPITAEPESYQEIVGYPSYINTSIGQCEGLCVCDDIDLNGITGATEAELDEIARMCKEGIWV